MEGYYGAKLDRVFRRVSPETKDLIGEARWPDFPEDLSEAEIQKLCRAEIKRIKEQEKATPFRRGTLNQYSRK